MSLIRDYAIYHHNSVNHYYDNQPYEIHLDMVVEIANKFIHLIPENDRQNIINACYLHDTIEDCRLSYSSIRNITNTLVADIVYAVTNEKGKTRAERQNDKYYSELRNNKYAIFVKLCDRIANTQYSKNTDKYKMYQKELKHFIDKLYCEEYKEMFEYLKTC